MQVVLKAAGGGGEGKGGGKRVVHNGERDAMWGTSKPPSELAHGGTQLSSDSHILLHDRGTTRLHAKTPC